MRFVWDGNTILHEYFLQDNSDIFRNFTQNALQTDADIANNLVA